MAKNKYDDMVVFGNGSGGFVSNDWNFDADEYAEYLAGKKSAGKGSKTAKVEETAATEVTGEDVAGDEEELEEEEGDEGETSDYSALKGAELKALAAERGVDIKGMTKKSEVVAALVAADAAPEE